MRPITIRILASFPHYNSEDVQVKKGDPPPTPCKDCIHFKQSWLTPVKYGRCTMFQIVNVIDGSVNHKYASVARVFDCKGEYLVEKNTSFKFW